MNIINSRHSAILQYLLEHTKPVSAEAIGNSIGTSARVIRQNIPTINRWLKSYGVEIECKPNFGILLTCTPDVKTKIIKVIQDQNKERVYSLKDRQQLILFELLSKSNQFSESKLRNQLNISKSTLSNDLDRVEKWLNDKDLFLSRRPRIGVTVQGRENDIRHALITLLYESGLETELIRLALWEVKKRENHFYMLSQSANYILSELAKWRLSDGWNFVSAIENELNTKFADGDHLTLTLYWVIAGFRIKQDHFIQLSDERIQYLSTRPEYKAIQDIIVRIINLNYFSISEAEIAQFTLEIMTSRGTFSNLDEDQSINPQEKTLRIAKELFAKISQYLGADLTNSVVILQLAEHLSRVVIRMKFDLPIQNNLTKQAQKAYPLLWQATEKAIYEVWDEAGPPLPKEEIAFITMYVALASELNKNIKQILPNPRVVVACPSGGVTVWMLVSRLRSELPELEIKEVVSLRDITSLDPSEVDVIISSTTVNTRNIKSITVNPFLTDRDIKQIKDSLEYYKIRH